MPRPRPRRGKKQQSLNSKVEQRIHPEVDAVESFLVPWESSAGPALEEESINLISGAAGESSAGPVLEEESRMISESGESSAGPVLEEESINLISGAAGESSAGPALEEESRIISESAPKSQFFVSKRKQKMKTNEQVLEEKRRMILDVKAKSKDCKTNVCKFLDVKAKSKDCKANVFLKHIPRNIIIAFVEAIEKGHYYFYFKDYLNKCDIIKHDSDPNHIYGILLKMPELDVMFTKVDKADLLYAIEEHIFKVQNNRRDNMRHDYANYLPNCKFIMPQSDSYKDLEEINREGLFDELTSDDKETGLRLYKRFLYFHHPTKENPVPKFYCIGFHRNGREEEEAAPTNPIYNLIFQIRRGKHNMHLNPEVELEKIRKSDPSFYYGYFVDWSPRKTFAFVPSRMVAVSDVPFGVSVQDMKKFFSSCGDVEYVHIYRGDRKKKSHCVLVTFKESAGAKCAVLFSGKKMTIRGTTKVITVQPGSDELVVTSELPKPLDLVAAEAIVSSLEKTEDVGSVLAQVLEKYWLFSKYVEPGWV